MSKKQITSSPIIMDDDEEEVIIEEDRGRGCGFGFIAALGCMSIPIAIILCAVAVGVTSVNKLFNGVGDLFNLGEPTYNQFSAGLILERVETLSELTTVSYNFSNIVRSERDLPRLLEALYRDELVMVVVGQIDAGVDLSQLTEDDFIISGNRLTISLPAPQLFDCLINEGESYVVERDTGFFASPAPNLDAEARRFAIREFRDAAIRRGILNEAGQQAAAALDNLITLANYEGINLVDVVVPTINPDNPDAETIYPATCNP